MKTFVAALLVAGSGLPGVIDVVDWEYRDGENGTPVTFVPAGSAVTWRILEGIHTVRATAGGFASGVLFEGQSYQATPREGAHAYSCEIHEWMRGVVVVTS